MKKFVLIVGATSGIASATAYVFASHGHHLILAGRDQEDLQTIASDIQVRYGVDVRLQPFDGLDYQSHPLFLQACAESGELEGALLCYGHLGDQARAQEDFSEARAIVDVNFTSYVSLLHLLASHFEQRRAGWICAISSVAGDRGRQSNYVYGAAKGAMAFFLQGLRQRLFRSGVRVITVKPGFVATKMTYGLVKEGPLVARPDQVAKGIYHAIKKGKHEVYLPGFWKWIMLIIKLIPGPIFNRLRL